MGIAAAAIARGLAAQPGGLRARASGCASTGASWCCCWRRTPPARTRPSARVLLDPEPPHLLIALNDRTADGNDVSWIWDVDYEPLLARAASLTLTGDRAYDLALRVRYAGRPVRADARSSPTPRAPLDAAVAATPVGGTLYVLPTYTAMLGLRETLVRRGAAEAFWRER